MNRLNVTRVSAYIMLGMILWVAVLKSGVHATLAGVVIALFIPMRDDTGRSPLRELEHDLHSPVAFAILPIFAFANAGLSMSGMSIADILLFVGLVLALRIGKLPDDVSFGQLLGVAFACGIGFTMSLFIAGLAFEHGGGDYFAGDRLGVLLGSVLSAVIAYIILHFCLPKTATN